MRYLELLMFTVLAVVSVQASNTRTELDVGLARLFSITVDEAKSCLRETGATEDDMGNLEQVVTKEVTEKIDSKGVKRASRALVCCAQLQGTMVGPKIQMSKIHQVIDTMGVPPEVRTPLLRIMNECSSEVTQITDETDVVVEFLKCMVTKCRIVFGSGD
ncbi:PREDICTED: pheromone-binding protein Gp-9-like [Dufourea novaeangliae]|uniref:pheromone-binding protein Gp-9-like n=1 Tax=Dufourea novaeangliae TaxID=178035 RepID=UPI000767630E|nr:PREDICTED: pheromone-binding protein Gp-9-like [Dufourea novaeangliae]